MCLVGWLSYIWGVLLSAALASESIAPAVRARKPWRVARAEFDPLVLLQTAVETPATLSLQSEAPSVIDDFSYTSTLTNFGNVHYAIPLTLGRQEMWGIIDTGSFDLVVFGTDCVNCETSAVYSSALSPTYKEGLLTTDQSYGDEHLTSVVARDTLSIGPFSLANQTFWNTRSARAGWLPYVSFNAIIGAGPPEAPMADAWEVAEAAVDRVAAYYDLGLMAPDEAAAEAKKRVTLANEVSGISSPLRGMNLTTFSICLGSLPGSDGLLIWNDTAVSSQPDLFRKIPVSGRHTWSANLSDVRLAIKARNASVPIGCSEGCSALVDSASSLLAVPGFVMDALDPKMDLLDERCGNLHVLPDIAFRLGEAEVVLPPSSYVARVVADDARRLRMAPHLYSERPCQLLLTETRARAETGPIWILGQPFFRSYYTVFSAGATKSARALYIAPHGSEDCRPSDASAEPNEIAMSVEAAKIRLPQTVQLAATEGFVNL